VANDRTREVVEALVDSIRAVIKDKKVNYEEYRAATQFLVRLANSGEIPLLLAVFLEAGVDEITHASSQGSTTTI
jgi:chlorocatechol 1,2-dioxygenase